MVVVLIYNIIERLEKQIICPQNKGTVKKQSKKSEVHDNPWVSDNFFIKNRYLRRNFKIVLFLGYKE